MREQSKVLITLSILIVSVVIGICVVLFGTENIKEIHVQTYTIDTDINKTIRDDNVEPILLTTPDGINYFVQGVGTNFFVNLTPDQQSSSYIAVRTKGFDVDREQTFMQNEGELNTCAESEIFGDGKRYFTCGINQNNWQFKFGNHISFLLYVHKSKLENQTLPTVYMNQTGVDTSQDIISNNVTLNDGCKTIFEYNKATLQDTREYTVSGNCTNVDLPLLQKYVKQFLTEKSKELTSSEELTQGTNACTVGFDCPKNTSKYYTEIKEVPPLTEATNCISGGPCNPPVDNQECSGITMELCEQNKVIIQQQKEILSNQNIQMCLEVVKNPDSWVSIGKYLTERSVNCTGLDIK